MNKLNVKHIVLLIAFVVMATMEMFAAKAVPGAMQVTLVDGRTVTVSLRGDEHLNFLISSDNEIIIREGDTYRVATEEEREDIFNSATKLDEEILANQAKAIGALQANSGEGISGDRLFPHVGTPKVLVLMAEFADVSFTFSKHEIDSLLNSDAVLTRVSTKAKSYSTGEEVVMSKLSNMRSYSSVSQYFNDCSDGLFKPQFDVYGPYTLAKNMKVYGDGANDRMDLFIPQVCALANAEVDFSEYDQDGDGYVDLVYVIYAGYSANWTQNGSDCIWPKSGPSTGTSTTYGVYDGKTVSRYGVNGELLAYPMSSGAKYLNGIGVFCHEFSHTMGLPDFYPASTYNPNVVFANWSTADYDNQSLEDWDLMDGGENNTNGCWPPMYSAFERELMGWIKIDTLDTPSDVTLTPLLHGGKAYRILNDNDPTGNEYWIVEAVSTDEKSEKWQQYLPGKGMLITHVNYNPNTFNIKYNNVNATKGKPGITIIPADGYLPSSYRVTSDEDELAEDPTKMSNVDFCIQESGDPYPGSQGITEFNNYKAYTGTVDKPITDIVQNDDFTVSFKFMGGGSEIEIYNVSLLSEPLEGGTVKGDGTYNVNSDATIIATPTEGYRFVGWSDGVTDSLRTITVVNDTVLTALFEEIPDVVDSDTITTALTFVESTQTTVTLKVNNFGENSKVQVSEQSTYTEENMIDVAEDNTVTISGLKPSQGDNDKRRFYLYVDEERYGYIEVEMPGLDISVDVIKLTPTSFNINANYTVGDACIESTYMSFGNNVYDGGIINVTGLKPDTAYTVTYNVVVRYGIDNEETEVYSVTQTVNMPHLTFVTAEPKVVSAGNVIVGAETNIGIENANVGFEWRRSDYTSEFPSKYSEYGQTYISGTTMEGKIMGLTVDKLWKYRPYYLADDNTYYFGDWMGIDPSNTSYFEPVVRTYADIEIDVNTAIVKGYVLSGTDNIIAQGFKFWLFNAASAKAIGGNLLADAVTVPENAQTVEASGEAMDAKLTGLAYNSTYSYVTFVETSAGIFYGEQRQFTTANSLLGDVNGDGYITMADANMVVNYFLADETSKPAEGFNVDAADMNRDGTITMADANAIVNAFLGE